MVEDLKKEEVRGKPASDNDAAGDRHHGTGEQPSSTPGVGVGRESLAELRARCTRKAYSELHKNPAAAREIGETFKKAFRDGYLEIRSKPGAEKAARDEADRVWSTVLNGFGQDWMLREGLKSVKKNAEQGKSLSSLISEAPDSELPGDSLFRPSVEFCRMMLKALQKPIDDFWREGQSGGKYEDFFNEYRRAQNVGEDVMRGRYEEFRRALEVGKAKVPSYEEFATRMTQVDRSRLERAVMAQVKTIDPFVAMFSVLTPSHLSRDGIQELFQQSRKALAEKALLPRAADFHSTGPFRKEFEKKEPDMDTLKTEARKVFGLQPHEDLTTPLEPQGLKTPARCPGSLTTGTDGTPANEVLVELAGYVAPETYWPR